MREVALLELFSKALGIVYAFLFGYDYRVLNITQTLVTCTSLATSDEGCLPVATYFTKPGSMEAMTPPPPILLERYLEMFQLLEECRII